MVLEPIFEKDFAEQSYGFRPRRGCKDALRRVEELLKAGYTCIVDADLKSYFDTIPHDRLMDQVGRKVSDGRVLSLIEGYLKQGVLDGLHEWTPETGSPQGAVISPLLSNIYLDPLDHLMARRRIRDGALRGRFRHPVSPSGRRGALETVRQWTANAGLTLHPTKTRVIDANAEGFDFLGYHFEGGTRRPRAKSLDKFKNDDPPEDEADLRREPAGDHYERESDPAGLV